MQRVGPMASFVHMRALPAARVQDPVELFIKLDVKGDLSETASMVTVRDLQTARLLYRDSRKGDRFVFPVSPGLRVRVEIEVPGHRRAKFDVEIDSQGPKAFCVELEPSSIPLGLQQLYGFQTVEPKPDCSVQSGSGDNAGGGVTT